MAMTNGMITVGELIEKLQGMDANELPIRIANYEGDHGMAMYTARKHVVTDEDDQIVDAYVVING